MALDEYWTVVKRWWWLLVLSTLVAAASSYIAVQREPRIYQATTTTMVGQALQRANPSSQDIYISQQLAQTYINMVQRRIILEGAAEALGLSSVPRAESVSASIVAGTQLVEISVRDTSPDRAQVLADEIANQLILQTPTESEEDQSRREFAQQQLDNLKTNIETTGAEIREEQARLDAANSARAIQQYQTNIAALQQKLSNYQSTYASLIGSVEGGTNYISIVERATLPTDPISPDVPQTVAVAAVIGLGLAVGGAFLIEFLDNTVRTADDLRKVTNLPVLGVIGRVDSNSLEHCLIVVQEPRSAIAEAYRALRTNIQFSAVDAPVHTLLVTSPGPYEGKSFTAANLAVVVAQSGRSVILVDADLRRPTQHEVFGLGNDCGLSSAILAGQDDRRVASLCSCDNGSREGTGPKVPICLGAKYLQETGIPNLRVMTSGPIPPNPADLIGSERMRVLVHELAHQADYLIFDTPPILAVTEAAVLSTRVEGVLIVTDAGRTRRALVGRAVEELGHVDARVLGAVLNRVSLRQDGYYAPYYDYGVDRDRTREHGRLSTARARLGELLGITGRKPRSRTNGSDNYRRPQLNLSTEDVDSLGGEHQPKAVD